MHPNAARHLRLRNAQAQKLHSRQPSLLQLLKIPPHACWGSHADHDNIGIRECHYIIQYSIGDFIEDRTVVSPSPSAFNLHLKEQMASVLKTLTPREEKVVKMRFGLDDGVEHTLEEVGQSSAVTRERIRQIEAKALRKLRHPSRSRKLRAFLEGPSRDYL